ncbi:hypothetical protein CLM62_16830 [Streptomyces sp. SA15]|nr:hypothetical protein CLM62_16830 [Streptomyces sp. SA15]
MWASPSQSTLPRLRLSSSAASLMASRASTRAVAALSRVSGLADSTMSIISLRSWPSKLVLPKPPGLPGPAGLITAALFTASSTLVFCWAASWRSAW